MGDYYRDILKWKLQRLEFLKKILFFFRLSIINLTFFISKFTSNYYFCHKYFCVFQLNEKNKNKIQKSHR